MPPAGPRAFWDWDELPGIPGPTTSCFCCTIYFVKAASLLFGLLLLHIARLQHLWLSASCLLSAAQRHHGCVGRLLSYNLTLRERVPGMRISVSKTSPASFARNPGKDDAKTNKAGKSLLPSAG